MNLVQKPTFFEGKQQDKQRSGVSLCNPCLFLSVIMGKYIEHYYQVQNDFMIKLCLTWLKSICTPCKFSKCRKAILPKLKQYIFRGKKNNNSNIMIDLIARNRHYLYMRKNYLLCKKGVFIEHLEWSETKLRALQIFHHTASTKDNSVKGNNV